MLLVRKPDSYAEAYAGLALAWDPLRGSGYTQAEGAFRSAAMKALDLDPTEADAGANRARAILEGMEILISEFQRMENAPRA